MLCSSARGRRARCVTGVHGDELRMVQGVTVQHPAQIIGGQRRFVARKISASDLCAATMAQLRRGVPRLAGRFDLQWDTAQPWITEGGLLSGVHEGVVELLATSLLVESLRVFSSPACSLHDGSSHDRQRRV
jgi:hypothetical protein